MTIFAYYPNEGVTRTKSCGLPVTDGGLGFPVRHGKLDRLVEAKMLRMVEIEGASVPPGPHLLNTSFEQATQGRAPKDASELYPDEDAPSEEEFAPEGPDEEPSPEPEDEGTPDEDPDDDSSSESEDDSDSAPEEGDSTDESPTETTPTNSEDSNLFSPEYTYDEANAWSAGGVKEYAEEVFATLGIEGEDLGTKAKAMDALVRHNILKV